MKKFLAIALIATSFVACNEGETKTEETKSSDTTTIVAPVANDTMQVVTDTTTKVTVKTDTVKVN
jgi:hypothetical protein